MSTVPPVQVIGIAFNGNHERLDLSEANQAWLDLDRVLSQAGMGSRVERTYTNQFGKEYGYLFRTLPDGSTRHAVLAGELEYSTADCQQETGIAHPFSESASAVLRDNKPVVADGDTPE